MYEIWISSLYEKSKRHDDSVTIETNRWRPRETVDRSKTYNIGTYIIMELTMHAHTLSVYVIIYLVFYVVYTVFTIYIYTIYVIALYTIQCILLHIYIRFGAVRWRVWVRLRDEALKKGTRCGSASRGPSKGENIIVIIVVCNSNNAYVLYRLQWRGRACSVYNII